jgi:hypothetical protein
MKFNWFRRKDAELDAEIRNHLDEAIRDRLARGESPDEVRANALREFGNNGTNSKSAVKQRRTQ